MKYNLLTIFAAISLVSLTAYAESPTQFMTYAASSQIVSQLYRDTLGREPDPEGLAYYSNKLRSGKMSAAAIKAEMIASKEKQEKLENDRKQTITSIYREILGRDPDPAGLKFYMDKLAQKDGSYTYETLRRDIVNSEEAKLIAQQKQQPPTPEPKDKTLPYKPIPEFGVDNNKKPEEKPKEDKEVNKQNIAVLNLESQLQQQRQKVRSYCRLETASESACAAMNEKLTKAESRLAKISKDNVVTVAEKEAFLDSLKEIGMDLAEAKLEKKEEDESLPEEGPTVVYAQPTSTITPASTSTTTPASMTFEESRAAGSGIKVDLPSAL